MPDPDRPRFIWRFEALPQFDRHTGQPIPAEVRVGRLLRLALRWFKLKTLHDPTPVQEDTAHDGDTRD